MLLAALSQLPGQYGLFTAQQARRFGVSDDERRRSVRSGSWVRIRQGIYIDADLWRNASNNGSRRLIEIVAAQLSIDRESWASGLSACAVHGTLPPFPSFDRVDLTCIDGQTHYGKDFIVRVWPLAETDRLVTRGIPVLSASRSLYDAARELDFTDAVIVADQMLHRGLTSPNELLRLAERLHSCRGAPAFARVITFADGRSESPGESRSRVWFNVHGIPQPELQVQFFDARGLVGRSDFYWRRQRTIGEFDGRVKYSSDGQTLYAEKLREDRLRADNEVVRFGWSDVDPRSTRLLGDLHAAFRRGEQRPPPRFPGVAT